MHSSSINGIKNEFKKKIFSKTKSSKTKMVNVKDLANGNSIWLGTGCENSQGHFFISCFTHISFKLKTYDKY